jgi:hypothetical protein
MDIGYTQEFGGFSAMGPKNFLSSMEDDFPVK